MNKRTITVGIGVAAAVIAVRTCPKNMGRFFKKAFPKGRRFQVVLRKYHKNPYPVELYKFETGNEIYLGCKRIR
jgi:hypothetical protein